MIVTIGHARNLGYCARGMREWFESNGLDYQAFVNEGIDAAVLEDFKDDVMVQALLEEAKK